MEEISTVTCSNPHHHTLFIRMGTILFPSTTSRAPGINGRFFTAIFPPIVKRVMACQKVQRCQEEGYNICLDNKTGEPVTYIIGEDEAGIVTRSVTVPPASVICYKVREPIGIPVSIRKSSTIVRHYISGPVHITSILIGTLIRDIIDCSPCPIACTFTYADPKKPSYTKPDIPLLRSLKKLCSENYDDEGDSNWIFSP